MSRPFMALVGACTIIGTLLILLLAIGSASPTYAAEINRIAIDTDITGNTATPCDTGDAATDYPCNNSTVLGPAESCRVINVGDSIQIDVIGDSIPLGGADMSNSDKKGAGQSDMALDWTPSGPTGPIGVTGKDITVALVHQAASGNNSSGALDSTSPAATGNTSGHWKWSDVDVNTELAAEGGPGIAIRLTIKGLNAGTANLSLGTNQLSQPTFTDIHGNEYSVGQNVGATIIVGTGTCPTGGTQTAPPTASPTTTATQGVTATPCTVDCLPTGTPTLTPTPSPTPTQGVTATPCEVDCAPTDTPSPTASPTITPTITPTPTQSPTQVPTATTPHTNSPTPTATLTATPRPSGSATGTVKAGSGSPTPKSLPATGGPGGDSDSMTMLLTLAFSALLIAAAGGSVFAARRKRQE